MNNKMKPLGENDPYLNELRENFKKEVTIKDIEYYGGKHKYFLVFNINQDYIDGKEKKWYPILYDLIKNYKELDFSFYHDNSLKSMTFSDFNDVYSFYQELYEKFIENVEKTSFYTDLFDIDETFLMDKFKEIYDIIEFGNDITCGRYYIIRNTHIREDSLEVLLDRYNKLYCEHYNFFDLKNKTPFNRENLGYL